jgi:hypothetical protein
MIAAPYHPAPPASRRMADAIPVGLTLAAMTAILLFLGWTYVAQPQHPEGVCYESRGRPTPCVVSEQRAAER